MKIKAIKDFTIFCEKRNINDVFEVPDSTGKLLIADEYAVKETPTPKEENLIEPTIKEEGKKRGRKPKIK